MHTGTITMAVNNTFNENNIFFEPLQKLYTLLQENIIDLNPKRASLSEGVKRRFIYPTFPEKINTYFPRITIKQGEPTFEEFGNERFISEVKDTNGFTEREFYGNVAILPISIIIFTKKEQELEVTEPDGSKKTLKNSAINSWYTNHIQKKINQLRNKFIEADMDVKIINITGTYEDNEFLWASTIFCEMEILNKWVDEYSDGSIIKKIEKTVQINTS